MKLEKDLTGQLHSSTTVPLGRDTSLKDCLYTWQEGKAEWSCQYWRVGSISL